jgi:hypothetical protein
LPPPHDSKILVFATCIKRITTIPHFYFPKILGWDVFKKNTTRNFFEYM